MLFNTRNGYPIVEDPIRAATIPGIIPYDLDNSYPNRVLWLINRVAAAKQATLFLHNHIEGQGLTGAGVDEVVNERFETVADFHDQFTESKAWFGGAFVHISYTPEGLKDRFEVLEYQNVRVGDYTQKKYRHKLVYWNNWSGSKQRVGQREKERWFYAYNPDPAVVLAQMEECGGWDKYPGQIYFSKTTRAVYPTAPCHAVLAPMDTYSQLNTFTNNVVRQGLHHGDTIILPERLGDDALIELKEDIEVISGPDGAGSTLIIHGAGPGAVIEPRIKSNQDAIFRETEAGIIRQIRMNYGIPVALFGDLVSGKLGSTDEIKEGFEVYNRWTAKDRAFTQREMQYLFWGSTIPSIDSQDFYVEPLAPIITA